MRRKLAPGSTEEWLRRAKSNLAIAKQPKPEEVFWEDLCFEAHQAIEKALKAVYQKHGMIFDYTHDLEVLTRGLEKLGIKTPTEARQAVILNRYSYEGKYPGSFDPAKEKDFKTAVVLAEAVVRWAEKIVARDEEPGVQEKRAAYRAGKRPKKKLKSSVRRG